MTGVCSVILKGAFQALCPLVTRKPDRGPYFCASDSVISYESVPSANFYCVFGDPKGQRYSWCSRPVTSLPAITFRGQRNRKCLDAERCSHPRKMAMKWAVEAHPSAGEFKASRPPQDNRRLTFAACRVMCAGSLDGTAGMRPGRTGRGTWRKPEIAGNRYGILVLRSRRQMAAACAKGAASHLAACWLRAVMTGCRRF